MRKAPEKGSRAEFVEMLSSVLAHPEMPYSLNEAITDALIEMSSCGRAASREHIAYAMHCDASDEIPVRNSRRSGQGRNCHCGGEK